LRSLAGDRLSIAALIVAVKKLRQTLDLLVFNPKYNNGIGRLDRGLKVTLRDNLVVRETREYAEVIATDGVINRMRLVPSPVNGVEPYF
jgi:hypothetical protein